jgi:3'-phosphoadenosine 5'-phosphosulfate sulfotransferase (PAPS reductase)/FAD synthetase
MNINELRTMQNYPLDLKIMKTKLRIQEWINEYGAEGVYVAFSGGKDSTVLLHIVREMYPNVEGVFANTGNEFPEIVQFVRKQENIKWVKPRKSFAKVIKEEGYPVISKKTSRMIKDCQNPTEKNAKSRKLYLSDYALDKEGNITNIKNNSFKIAYKHRYLINAPFKISNKCCDYLKKYPMADYEKLTGKKAIIGTQAEESKMRESAYLQTGCNNFKGGKSNPLGFWRSQDILEYIYKYNIEIASIYGEVKIDKDGKYYTTGEQRTGCCMCLFGCGLWKTDEENRVLRLEKTHPKLHNHMINNLGFKEVLEYMNIKYTVKDIDTEKEKSKLGNEDVEQFKWII